jgi:putative ABC transport system ATP-binding protein
LSAGVSTDPVIETHDLRKVFLTEDLETHALGGINLRVDRGEFVAVVGPSGSGKTTLLAILGLMDLPTSGEYKLAGARVENLSDRELARARNAQVGFIFQTYNLIGHLSVEQNVEIPLTYQRVPAAERRKRVARALDRVGMTHRSRHMPGQLSGGQQQRVAVARALVGEPQILLADEPTGNLDSANGNMIMDLIAELHRSGSTICMVTHDSQFARRAQRSIRLSDGRILEELS